MKTLALCRSHSACFFHVPYFPQTDNEDNAYFYLSFPGSAAGIPVSFVHRIACGGSVCRLSCWLGDGYYKVSMVKFHPNVCAGSQVQTAPARQQPGESSRPAQTYQTALI